VASPPEAAPGHPEIARIVAPNPGPMTLAGTNTYVVGRDPAYVIDPGPADAAHIEAVQAAGDERGGIAGALLTHSHSDHSEGVTLLGAPLLWGEVSEGDEASGIRTSAPDEVPSEVGPFRIVPTPGHAADHVCFVWEDVCFCGDLILGEGSSIVLPAAWGGSLADYMGSLERVEGLDAALMCPGHGPWITDPSGRIAEYARHRREREGKLVRALESGERSKAALLDAAWDDVPQPMRPMAALAMQAHLEKLELEGRLPQDLRD
jgi:glyoxylase-like metal-dependent hydrolase (beta-lactamase superfamily II)